MQDSGKEEIGEEKCPFDEFGVWESVWSFPYGWVLEILIFSDEMVDCDHFTSFHLASYLVWREFTDRAEVTIIILLGI